MTEIIPAPPSPAAWSCSGLQGSPVLNQLHNSGACENKLDIKRNNFMFPQRRETLESQSEAGLHAAQQTGHQDRTCSPTWRSGETLIACFHCSLVHQSRNTILLIHSFFVLMIPPLAARWRWCTQTVILACSGWRFMAAYWQRSSQCLLKFHCHDRCCFFILHKHLYVIVVNGLFSVRLVCCTFLQRELFFIVPTAVAWLYHQSATSLNF